MKIRDLRKDNKMKIINIFIFTYSVILICTLINVSYSQELKPTDKKALVNFIVTDFEQVPEQGAVVKISYKSSDIVKGITDIDGKFSTLLDKGKTYKIIVKKFGKTFNFGKLEIPDTKKHLIITQPLKIRIVTNYIRTYTLENIFFDFNKYTLKPASYKTLDTLVKDLKANPNMIIEVAGHTDNVGDDKFNMRLSQKRANAVREYLIKHGISPHRIIAKGYGETQPITTNKTEIGRRRNRRVEVRVIRE